MEAVRSNRSHRPGSSLNKVGPSQLMWAHSQIMWAEAKLQSQVRRPIVSGRYSYLALADGVRKY